VGLGERSYDIDIGSDLIRNAWSTVAFSGYSQIVVVSNTTVFALHGTALMDALRKAHENVVEFLVGDGEQYKDAATLQQVYDALLTAKCDRKTLLIALGGGVIGDIVGFAAATYQRGISFLQVPTTLLAQVDSSVGGKTAINHPLGKNMIGAFYQPKRVVIDTDVLATLPEREYRAGLAEVVKYGIALNIEFFDWIEANAAALLSRERDALIYAIKRSCEIKADVVAADEHELSKTGGRALLNFGHTFGHAIESALGYGVWLHGEAVGCGAALATQFSASLGRIDAASSARVLELIKRLGLQIKLPPIAPERMLEEMSRDKKNESGTIRLILLDAIGQSRIDGGVSREAIRAFLAASD
jgi:3-dehydroquinate synthase